MSVYRLELSGRDKPVFTLPVDEVCFSKPEEDNEYARQAKATDLAFFLRRQDPEINLRGLQLVLVSSEEREQTAVGYLPIILAPAHEFDTLNTVVNRCMAISSRFGQEHTVITSRPPELRTIGSGVSSGDASASRTRSVRVQKRQFCCKEIRSQVQPMISGPGHGMDKWHRKERRRYHWNYQEDISAVQVDTLL